ncbi:RHS repeat protein [Pontibacter sp. E15-1]|uniref:RHS repeat domain-containing protein n=1 Tax=Pontibacter sp. E15-1 TaxID=2919918 RepID=UPI001F4FF652|nr:RHS repeat domain-containing protein [Pontibacter sp. E15-1]MCJ8165967.1 RHS repeat protein [Pontibacter sp. E15-1]
MDAIKRIITSLLLFLLTLLPFTQAFAQSEDSYTPNLPKVLPPTPEAASLGRYGEVPVSLHTGAANVGIPIFELGGKGISVPVSLGYNSSGVRVEEVATWVGMGWSLNAGGAVTRSVRGLPDEQGFFVGDAFNADGTPYAPACDPQNADYYERIRKGETDTHPDVFYYNLLGRSGKFFFDKNKTPLLTARDKLDIDHPFDSPTVSQQWRIRDEAGVTYVLGSFEGAGATEYTESNSFCSYQQSLSSTRPMDAVTSWLLMAVISPTGDVIRFNYEGYTMRYEVNGGGSISHKVWGTGSQTKQSICQKNEVTQHAMRLTSITSSGGSVEFSTSVNGRSDVWKPSYLAAGAEGPEALVQIIAKDPQGAVVRDFRLGQGYFGSPSDVAAAATGSVAPEMANRLRLRLDEVRETLSGQRHAFGYYAASDDSWPSRLSSAQDHWGFYNGKANQNLVPGLTYDGVPYPGADREPDFNYMRMGALRSVTYPTGGTSTFEYGQHDYNGKRRMIQYRTRTEFLASVYVNTYSGYGNSTSTDNASFTLAEATSVDIRCTFNCTQPGGLEGCGFVTLTFPDGHSQEYGDCLAAGTAIRLEPGTYSLSAQILGGEAEISFSLQARQTEQVPDGELQKVAAGGLRIERIASDGLQGPPVVKRYVYEVSPGVSSGSLLRELRYERTYTKDDGYYTSGKTGESLTICTDKGTSFAEYLEVTALSYVPLYYASDYGLGYSLVTELLGESGDGGRTVYVYGLSEDDLDPTFRHGLEPVLAHRNGLLYDKTVYGANGNKLQRVSNRYTFRDLVRVYGFEFRQDHYSGCTRCGDTEYWVDPYANLSEWYHLDSVITRTFDPSDETLYTQSVEKRWYENPAHMQPTRVETLRSDGQREGTLTLYPHDYGIGTAFLEKMKAAHLVAFPVEQVLYTDRGGAQRVLGGRLVKYREDGQGLKASEHLLETEKPVEEASFSLSNRPAVGLRPSGTPEGFFPDSRYAARVAYDKYDSRGNLRQFRTVDRELTAGDGSQAPDGQPVAYLWGYGGQYPIAQVQNAPYAEVEAALGGAAAVEALAVSSEPSQAQLDMLNGLRTQLPDARVTLYAYAPLAGVTSVTDPNGRVTYYEYDSFGRLHLVKDQDGNILKQQQYIYRK